MENNGAFAKSIQRGLGRILIGLAILPVVCGTVHAQYSDPYNDLKTTVTGIEDEVEGFSLRYETLREGYRSKLKQREKQLLFKRFTKATTSAWR